MACGKGVNSDVAKTVLRNTLTYKICHKPKVGIANLYSDPAMLHGENMTGRVSFKKELPISRSLTMHCKTVLMQRLREFWFST
jgi:hypothetical protein